MTEVTFDNNSATRRKARAEEQHELSISHYQGDLHTHTRTDISEPKLPEDIVESRRGSNCGEIPLGALVAYHSQVMKNQVLAITNHSRDANPKAAVDGIRHWFVEMYKSHPTWLQENFHKSLEELDTDDWSKIQELAASQAKQVALYGDERLEQIIADIDVLDGKDQIQVLKGVEVSLKPDGSFDTELVDQGVFDLVNVSIHPQIDPEKFASIIASPKEYTELVVKGIRHPKANTICHIGFDCEPQLVEELDWDQICQAAIENNVAIEINLNDLMRYIYKEMLNYEKYPADSSTYKTAFKEKLPQLIHLLTSSNIRNKLRQYLGNGLKLAINTDQHKSPYIQSETTQAGTTFSFTDHDFRFWRCLKMTEKYFNQLFTDAGVGRENIINTFSQEELTRFLHKVD